MNGSMQTFAQSGALLRDRRQKTFKIIVIGDSNVGKTCLTFRFCGGQFPERIEATIGVDFREKRLKIDNEEILLQLWDTAGQERFRRSMVQHYYRNVHAVVFVYDVTRLSSFQSLPLWIEECNMNSLNCTIPRILVGNKCDCKDQLAVPTNIAQRFADQHCMPLFETSAKDDSDCDHIEGIFITLAHKLKASKPMMPIDPSHFPIDTAHRSNELSVGRGMDNLATDSSSSCYC
ncbi:Ras-related protein Rab-33B [Halocaridina rubra]|uniref:Ras-related protein Rab-33B n=1 Tax=Halocaridina rubra TaxID=373956 RepID=A0AAN9A511_HALRR